MDRETSRQRVRSRERPWDLAVIGGGATGVGIALDSAARGYETLLLEQSDFGKGTSSRSIKLVHGGVRYLEQGNISLVMEALKERGLLRQNAPHLVLDRAFVVPTYDWWEGPFYGVGLKIYDLLAGKYGFGRSKVLSKEETIQRIPTVATEGLRGGVVYFDGQFDDARLLLNLAQTASEQGATLINYVRVTGLTKNGSGFLEGLTAKDLESGEEWNVAAKVVVNATGPFSDSVRRLDDPSIASFIRPSQGVHLVLDRDFLPGDDAILVPHTSDGRVLFAIPWHEKVVVGTTDTPVTEVHLEPKATEEEVHFILNTAGIYLQKAPTLSDVRSVFAGIRPLVSSTKKKGSTASVSRDHTLEISPSGLVSIAGGKWTTYRKMAEDVVDQAATLAGLPQVSCPTKNLPIHGWAENPERFGEFRDYGSDAPKLAEFAESVSRGSDRIHPNSTLTRAQVLWAIRKEMARTVEDVLARRTRLLFLEAETAIEIAPQIAEIMGPELGHSSSWAREQVDAFRNLARNFTLVPRSR